MIFLNTEIKPILKPCKSVIDDIQLLETVSKSVICQPCVGWCHAKVNGL